MNGLNTVNIELTSRCNKSCAMCGRRKQEREHPELCDWGDMDIETVKIIHAQIPKNIVVQFHNNGEPLLYPYLGPVLKLFQGNIRQFNTNGKLLLDKADDIIGNLEVLTVSVIEKDTEGGEQYDTVSRFSEYLQKTKGETRPTMVYRLLGKVDNPSRWEKLPGKVAKRILHSPDGSRNYKRAVTIPEIGICLDLLSHLAIDRYGNISMCVRFDPHGHLRIGHVTEGLHSVWVSPKRKKYIEYHLMQKRNELPGCKDCHYWGVPRGE